MDNRASLTIDEARVLLASQSRILETFWRASECSVALRAELAELARNAASDALLVAKLLPPGDATEAEIIRGAVERAERLLATPAIEALASQSRGAGDNGRRH